jgi:hypothetical protein
LQALLNPDEHFVSCSREKDVRRVVVGTEAGTIVVIQVQCDQKGLGKK